MGGTAMLYHLEFEVGYGADMTQQDLFDVWREEGAVAIGAKQAGVIVDLWKVVGERRVIAIVDIDSPNTLDQILFDLPLMKRMGQHVTIHTTPIRRYEDFAEDVTARLKG
jgi:muconolactone delta-isomerase